jgi:hypothetical protein
MREASSQYAVTHLLVLLIRGPMLSLMLIVSSRYHYFPFLHWTTHSQAALAAVLRIYQAKQGLASQEVHLPLKVAILPPMTEVTIVAQV